MSNRLVLVDGSGYIFRAFHALPPMSRSDGTPVNAVFGYTSMLLKLSEDMAGDHMLVVFDAARKTFRNNIYKEYKANRSDPPEELIPQFELIREATKALGIKSLEIEGFEADDIIASYCKLANTQNIETLIVSSDKDLMQLVKKNVSLLDPMKNIKIGINEVKEKFGVLPSKVIDVQSLAGDSSDNIPGVPGIGVKTAALLINEFGDLDSLLENANQISQNKRRENLIQFAEMARISRQLVTLVDNISLPISIKELTWKERNSESLIKFLRENNFKRLESKFQSNEKKSDNLEIKTKYELINDIVDLQNWLNRCKEVGLIGVDTETNSLDPMKAKLVGVSLAIAPGDACYIPLRHSYNEKSRELFEQDQNNNQGIIKQLSLKEALPLIKELFEDQSVLKVGHNIKYDKLVLLQIENGEINIEPADDTMCLSYVINAGRFSHKLDNLILDKLQHQTIKYEEICGKGSKQITFDMVHPELALNYAAEDADYCLRIYKILKAELFESKLFTVYETLEKPLINVLVNMEHEGILIDSKVLNSLSKEFSKRLNDLEEKIFEISKEKFNIASPKQLGEILFERLNLPGGKKTKSGSYGTSISILEDLSLNGFDIATKIIEWRGLSKLKSTYTDALQESINKKTKRVHTSYSMSSASTGRLSSSNPNIQNIPIRTSDGRRIREAFISKKGTKLLSADYSQIELRLVAHVAKEEAMLTAFKDGKDIHAETASQVFKIPLQDLDIEMRRSAKAINFGIIYGISPFGLSKQLGCSQNESKNFIDAYFEQFPKIKTYMEEEKEKAKSLGYVETLFGRKIPIRGINSKIFSERGFAERQAINAPIQGSAADIIKRAMIRLNQKLIFSEFSSRMLLQVHDELVFECPEDEIINLKEIIIHEMENAHKPVCELSVPLIVDCGVGLSWSESH